MPKASIITPVYKAESFIERCARSLFEQTFEDIEYIFVDDCSPDNSIQILQRKESLLAATGDFVAHCDSDDWMDVHAIEELYVTAINNDSDMVLFDAFLTDGRTHKRCYSIGNSVKKKIRIL